MSCFNKIKALAIRQEVTIKDLSEYFDMSYNSFNNKMRDCETRFNLKDLISYLNKLNLKLAVVDENEKVLEIFDKNDIKKKENNN